jgi:hypothetical protein
VYSPSQLLSLQPPLSCHSPLSSAFDADHLFSLGLLQTKDADTELQQEESMPIQLDYLREGVEEQEPLKPLFAFPPSSLFSSPAPFAALLQLTPSSLPCPPPRYLTHSFAFGFPPVDLLRLH